MTERRAHQRYPTGEYGILRKLEAGAVVREQVAYITNVSPFGLGIQLDRPISVGATVTVYAGDTAFVGTVVYCRTESDGFAAGLALHCETDEANRLLNDARRRAAANGKR